MDFDFEKLTEPFVDDDYTSRRGYDENFLGVTVPLPRIADLSVLAGVDDGGHIIPYEHFSIIMHAERRLAILTASNVDASEKMKKPEPGFDYSRRGLSGLGKNDIEKWIIDPRIDPALQLPDKFYTKDRGNFDKGHIVRRDDVAWGSSFGEVRRANGDTYHVTNCSPQVDIFNRSNLRGDWGRLENFILRQAEDERLILLAGPVLDDDHDKLFRGKDDEGPVVIQIPSSFWKIVIARNNNTVETYAFLLEQDLSDTEVEFNVDAEWQGKMISMRDLQNLLPDMEFPEIMFTTDRFDTPEGNHIRDNGSLEAYKK